MRLFNGANWMERQRRRAVAAGELIDVTQDARLIGLHETFASASVFGKA